MPNEALTVKHGAITMISQVVRSALLVATIAFSCSAFMLARAEEKDLAALAAALKDAKVTLGDGLKASKHEGKPVSAKFEIDEGKLQLSVYTMKPDGFTEVVIDPKTGAITKTEKITDAEDLEAATAQKAAMEKATVSLLAATPKDGHGKRRISGSQYRAGNEGRASDRRHHIAAG
jgi:hypothetical protein